MEEDFLPARFTMDGEIEENIPEDTPFYYERWPEIYSLTSVDSGNGWPNFQTDCYGAWLWGICYYAKIANDSSILDTCKESIDLTIEYLKMTWQITFTFSSPTASTYLTPSLAVFKRYPS